MGKRVNKDHLIGLKFGRLTITAISPGKPHMIAFAICDCGIEKKYSLSKIETGHTKSCGCYRKEKTRERSTKHGLTSGGVKHPLFSIWNSIKQRCYRPKAKNYMYYGGRGIKMCKEWLNSFLTFYNWAIANGWEIGLEVDRFPNNDGDYEPNNCRITTHLENMDNTSRNQKFTINGETKTVIKWSKQYGINKDTVYDRLYSGWNIKDALEIPIRKVDFTIKGIKNRLPHPL